MPLRTRFAPSPTGYLHLGHVVHACYVWGIARLAGAEIVLRIEDHDRQRCRPEYEQALLEDLEWLGLHPDTPAISTIAQGASDFRQSDCDEIYWGHLQALAGQGRVYGCDCSRKQISARLPQQHGEELRYDGHCRDRGIPAGASGAGIRLRLDEVEESFPDALLGCRVTQSPARETGDLLLRDRHGHWTYQFAVVVDDLRQGINLVIRGEDLLASTGRQLQLQRLLGATKPPYYLHHPLLTNDAGHKLSKRDFAEPIRNARMGGFRGDQILGQAAFQAGLQPSETSLKCEILPDLISSNRAINHAILRLKSLS